MATISSQLRKLQKLINIPYRIQFVNREIKPEEFQEKMIYVHIWINQGEENGIRETRKKPRKRTKQHDTA
jgi:hypothetical protein